MLQERNQIPRVPQCSIFPVTQEAHYQWKQYPMEWLLEGTDNAQGIESTQSHNDPTMPKREPWRSLWHVGVAIENGDHQGPFDDNHSDSWAFEAKNKWRGNQKHNLMCQGKNLAIQLQNGVLQWFNEVRIMQGHSVWSQSKEVWVGEHSSQHKSVSHFFHCRRTQTMFAKTKMTEWGALYKGTMF